MVATHHGHPSTHSPMRLVQIIAQSTEHLGEKLCDEAGRGEWRLGFPGSPDSQLCIALHEATKEVNISVDAVGFSVYC